MRFRLRTMFCAIAFIGFCIFVRQLYWTVGIWIAKCFPPTCALIVVCYTRFNVRDQGPLSLGSHIFWSGCCGFIATLLILLDYAIYAVMTFGWRVLTPVTPTLFLVLRVLCVEVAACTVVGLVAYWCCNTVGKAMDSRRKR